MTRLLVASAIAGSVGLTLCLSGLRWFCRPRLGERLEPYAAGGWAGDARLRLWSAASFPEALGPLARALGERLTPALLVAEDAERRLARIHSPMDVTAFRVRQVGWSTVAFGAGALLGVAARPGAPVVAALLLAAPVTVFALLEHQLTVRAARWQRQVFLELPVVVEQLGMLLSAGYSLTGALNRVARRGSGACALDLAGVCRRLRQGLSEQDALREWAAVVDVKAVDRLVPVLALNRDTSDLGRLLSEEARAIRRDVQRELVETVERRGQQVWIPVTVATLVPGIILLAIPFIEALRLFSG